MTIRRTSFLIVMPTFNEASSAPFLIGNILKILPDVSILVVDDNSQDGTLEAISKAIGENERKRVFFLKREAKLGLASAYKEGFQWGLARDYEYLIEMDADGSHQVKDLLEMMRCIQNDASLDLLIGSRWIDGGSIRNWPLHREFLSRIANRFAQILLGLSIHDSTSGFRIISAAALRTIKFSDLESVGYAFQIELVSEFTNREYVLAEYPIEFIEREHGRSKMSGAIALEACYVLFKWSLERIIRISLRKFS